MKAVIAMDSFKGSISSIEAGNAVSEGIRRVFPDADTIIKPVADGGEGTVEALVSGMNGELCEAEVSNPLGKPITTKYGILPDNTAVIEMAAASGLTLIPPLCGRSDAHHHLRHRRAHTRRHKARLP